MHYILPFFLLFCFSAFAQSTVFSKNDSLRGSLNEFRSYNVRHYDLNLRIDPEQRRIEGYNRILFSPEKPLNRIQLDLYENLRIDSVVHQDVKLPFERVGNAFFIDFPISLEKNLLSTVTVYYSGHPVVSSNPPWDGGFVWSADKNGHPWIGVACQGEGASLWWPNKDHLTDEPDSMSVACRVPNDLVCVSNGKFVGKTDAGNETIYRWSIGYPINNYNATINIGKYAHLSDRYFNAKGDTLALDYYPLEYNAEIAAEHFKQVKPMLAVFEDLFGPYPFQNDGYKLVETPYWGMEHQSAVAYGNDYKNNEFGFDFIIVHESGHEYWGNSITTHDLGQMWIHEAFTTYMEALYVEKMSGYDSALVYLQGQRERIMNQMAIQQPTGVNFHQWPDADMYYKGTWMLHTIRNVIDDDSLWFSILRGLHDQFKRSIVTAGDILSYIDERTPEDLSPIFDQYLNYPQPPRLMYKIAKKGKSASFKFKWNADAQDFNMPLKINLKNAPSITIRPETTWTSITLKNASPADIILPVDSYYFIPAIAP